MTPLELWARQLDSCTHTERFACLSVCLPGSYLTAVTSSVLRANIILRIEKLRTEINFRDVGV